MSARIRWSDLQLQFEKPYAWNRFEGVDIVRRASQTDCEEIVLGSCSETRCWRQNPTFAVHVDDRDGPSLALD